MGYGKASAGRRTGNVTRIEYDAIGWQHDSAGCLWQALFLRGAALAALRLCSFEARALSEHEGWSMEALLVREARSDGLDLVRVEPRVPGTKMETEKAK